MLYAAELYMYSGNLTTSYPAAVKTPLTPQSMLAQNLNSSLSTSHLGTVQRKPSSPPIPPTPPETG